MRLLPISSVSLRSAYMYPGVVKTGFRTKPGVKKRAYLDHVIISVPAQHHNPRQRASVSREIIPMAQARPHSSAAPHCQREDEFRSEHGAEWEKSMVHQIAGGRISTSIGLAQSQRRVFSKVKK